MADKKKVYDTLPEGFIPVPMESSPKSFESLPEGFMPAPSVSGEQTTGVPDAAWTLAHQGTGKRLKGETKEQYAARLKATNELAKQEALKSFWLAVSSPLFHSGLANKFIAGSGGALVGGVKGAFKDRNATLRAGGAGYIASKLTGSPEAGIATSLAMRSPDIVRGAVRGYKSAYQGTPVARTSFEIPGAAGAERTPVWINSPEGPIDISPELESIISKLPSGRTPGGIEKGQEVNPISLKFPDRYY